MKTQHTYFPEIKTEYDYFNFKINNRKIKLVYKIRQYKIVPDEETVQNLRKNKVKLYHSRKVVNESTKEVAVAYYRFYDEKVLDIKYKKELISKLLNIEVKDGLTLIEHIENKWADNGVNKTTDQLLMDKEAISLDVLASYLLGGYEGDNILTQKKEKKIADAECVSVEELIRNENRDRERNQERKMSDNKEVKATPFNTMTKEKYKKFLSKKRNPTKLDKLVALYSFNDHKDEYMFWDWLKGDWNGLDEEYHYRIDRLIDPEKPYLAKWCIVDTMNEFKLNEENLIIEDIVSQYSVGQDNSAKMERILVLEQFGERHYLDENIDFIPNELIKIK